jgi:hypothetical protein
MLEFAKDGISKRGAFETIGKHDGVTQLENSPQPKKH